jgi:hypothetical protein
MTALKVKKEQWLASQLPKTPILVSVQSDFSSPLRLICAPILPLHPSFSVMMVVVAGTNHHKAVYVLAA